MDVGLVGATVAQRYELLERIGRGGMGDVYRAHDRELDEEIALKVVRDELISVPGVLERFRAEVKLARRVTHRNVARTYELGRGDQLTYFTMELVGGESLTERLRTGPLPVATAIAITVELCDALAAAHAVGVIHRDLKPDNIMLARDGRVVLTDFGVAVVSTTADTGTSGTPRYMAPEQFRGERATAQVDVYALGLVLYEMVTGRSLYTGTVAAVLGAKQHDPPAADFAGVDPALAAIIGRAIALDPERRWPGVEALRIALAPDRDDARIPLAVSERKSELRLPMVLLMPPVAAAEHAHLAHGFHRELVARLTRRRHLRLLRRQRGTVDGRSARVSVELTDVATIVLELAGRAERVTLTVPIEVAALVDGAELTSRLIAAAVGAGPERDDPDPPLPPAALERVWRAYAELRRGEADRAAAHREFLAARELTPDDPRVRAGLAMCEVRAAFFRDRPEPESLALAESHASVAVQLAPHLAEAQIAIGHVRLHQGDATAAAIHFRTAIARAPYWAEAHEWLGRMLLEAGFLVDGMARVADVLEMEPDLEAPRWDLARAYALEGRWDDYHRLLDELRRLTGGLPGRFGWRLRIAGWRRDLDTVRAVRAEVMAAPHVPRFERELIVSVCDAITGVEWHGVRDHVRATILAPGFGSARRRAFVAQVLAEAAGTVGDVDTALSMVELAVDHGLFDRHWLERCPSLAPLRDHPRYPELRATVGGRADLVLDALFGDHASRATAATLLHTLPPR